MEVVIAFVRNLYYSRKHACHVQRAVNGLAVMLALCSGIALFPLSGGVFAQENAENTDLWRIKGHPLYELPPANIGGTWAADSLYMGATFLRDKKKPLRVWLFNHGTAWYKGALYILIPRPGKPDTALFLFHNKMNPPGLLTDIDLTQIAAGINHLDTLYFMYKSDSCGFTPVQMVPLSLDTAKLYTGPNRSPADVPAWQNLDKHFCAEVDSRTFYSISQQRMVPYGRRRCVAGWIHTVSGGSVRTDTVEFSFEDQYKSAHEDFSNIKFHVTGVFIIHPPQVDSIELVFFPPKDTIPAGDSIIYKGIIVGKDTLGQVFKDSTNLAKKIIWNLMKTPHSQSFMKSGTGSANPSNTNIFKAITAYEWDTVWVSYTDPKTGKVLKAWKKVYVVPGPPERLIIQGTTQQLLNDPTFSSRLGSITLDGATVCDSVYAVMRDRFGNWIGFATQSAWSSRDPGIARVFASGQLSTLGEGVIERVSLVDAETWGYAVQAQCRDSVQILLRKTPNKLLEIKLFDAATNTPIDTIKLKANQKMEVVVKAKWLHDSTKWVDISGTWSLQPDPDNIQWAVALPIAPAHGWICHPQSGGKELLTVTGGDSASNIQKTTVPIIVIPLLPFVSSAVARDTNENGLIDRIDLFFSKSASIDPSSAGAISVKSGACVWTVHAIVRLSDSASALLLSERQTNPANPLPQSSWKPIISMAGVPGVQDIPAATPLIAADGCPPVVWEVIKFITGGDHRTDLVQVTFSENAVSPGGGPFSMSNSPFQTFFAWDSVKAASPLLPMFSGIASFSKPADNQNVFFLMINNQDLNDRHYVNVRTPDPIVRDAAGNVPTAVNQRVRVKLRGDAFLFVFPNPAVPSAKHVQPGVIKLCHEPNAHTWVQDENAGVVMSITNVFLPPEGQAVKASIRITDIAGNIVIAEKTADLLANNPDKTTQQQTVDIYWNGSNGRGMIAAPGVYRAVICIDYPSSGGLKDVRFIRNVGLTAQR